MKTTRFCALFALILALMAPIANAQETAIPDANAPLTEVTQLQPDPGTSAPRLIVAAQTAALQSALK